MLSPDKLQLPPPKEWADFESLVRDITAARLSDPNVRKHGRPGQSQHGVDLYGKIPTGGIQGVQCKKKDVIAGHKVTINELRAEVRKARGFVPALAEFVLATTALDDGSLQREALRISQRNARRGLFSVRVDGWNSITDMLGEYPKIAEKHYGLPFESRQMKLALENESKHAPRRAVSPKMRTRKRRTHPPVVIPARVQHAFGLLASIAIPFNKEGLGALIGFGLLAAKDGRHLGAKRYFERAARLAERNEERYARAIAECNIGASAQDLGHPEEAVVHYRLARLISKEGQFTYPLQLATRGVAVALVRCGRYKQAEKAFSTCAEFERRSGHGLEATIAIHDVGVAQLYQHRYREARKTLRRSGAAARKLGEREWIYRGARDEALSYRDEGKAELAAGLLIKRISAFESAKDYEIAARLAEDVAILYAGNSVSEDTVESWYEEAAKFWRRTKDGGKEHCRILGQLASWRWEHAHFDRAIDALRERAKVAEKFGFVEDLCRSLDQLGACLQELNRHNEAAPFHRRAKTLARKLSHAELIDNTLNNLGELYRKLGKSKRAEALYRECEEYSRRRGEHESAVATAHNRALLLLGNDRRTAGKKLLQRCLVEARKRKYWREYVRALLGLGNAAAEIDNTKAAMRFYRKAVRVAAKHEVVDLLWAARVSLGGMLHSSGDIVGAIRELEAAEPLFAVEPSGNRYTSFLARCYRDTGEDEKANDAFERARIQALAVADDESVIDASIELARSVARKHGFSAGDDALRALMLRVSQEKRIAIYRAGIELAVEYREFKKGERWLRLITRAGKSVGQAAEAVDAHMLFGDALWQVNEYRLTAMQAFVTGAAHARTVSDEAFMHAGFHLMWKLCELAPDERLVIRSQAERWLNGTTKTQTMRAFTRFILWQFSIADHVGPIKGIDPDVVKRRVLRATRVTSS